MLRVWRFGSEDAAGPAGEDASAPSRQVSTRNRVRIQRLGKAGAILFVRFFSHLSQQILRAREEIVPSAFRFEFRKHSLRHLFSSAPK
jgi:hypothetical protein